VHHVPISPLTKNTTFLSARRAKKLTTTGVCAENFIRFDCVRESHNVGAYGCATLLLSDAAGLAVQIE
jgi:hypothetical protein